MAWSKDTSSTSSTKKGTRCPSISMNNGLSGLICFPAWGSRMILTSPRSPYGLEIFPAFTPPEPALYENFIFFLLFLFTWLFSLWLFSRSFLGLSVLQLQLQLPALQQGFLRLAASAASSAWGSSAGPPQLQLPQRAASSGFRFLSRAPQLAGSSAAASSASCFLGYLFSCFCASSASISSERFSLQSLLPWLP